MQKRMNPLPQSQSEYLRTVTLDTLNSVEQKISAVPKPLNFSQIYVSASEQELGEYTANTDMINSTNIILDRQYIAE